MRSYPFLAAILCVAQTARAVPASGAAAAVLPPPAAICGNGGLQWAYYADATKTDSYGDDVAYDPTALKSETPVESGVTSYLDYEVIAPTIGPPGPVYDDATAQPSSYFALNHRGYLLAPQTGNYLFSAAEADDISFLWIGQPAYAGWNKTNTDLRVVYNYAEVRAGRGHYKAPLVAGNFYPLRVVYKQGAGNALFQFSIEDPDGNVLIGSNSSAPPSPYIVQHSCDGILAPPYPPFGKET